MKKILLLLVTTWMLVGCGTKIKTEHTIILDHKLSTPYPPGPIHLDLYEEPSRGKKIEANEDK